MAEAAKITPSGPPNVLLIIADDLGVDASQCYSVGSDLPPMPNLSHLCKRGVVFDNMWSAPVCSPTRATILTGRYGFRTGVGSAVTGRGTNAIKLNEWTLPKALSKETANTYAHALIGK